MVLLHCLIADGSSFNQSEFPFENTGFFNGLRIVLLNILTKTSPRVKFIEYLLILFCFKI